MHSTLLLLAEGVILGVKCALAEAVASLANPTVTIASGIVIGTATQVSSLPTSTATVYNYLGIPFAAPPTGTARFAPPVTPTSWSSPLQATALPPACIQQFDYPKVTAEFDEKIFNNPGGPPPPESEDCLYLNVFAPRHASASNRKPVLFWIFGGSLKIGTGSLLIYNGSSFAAFQDVVVVTFNYRTNIFGFSNSPEIAVGEQNSGFLDQRLALQWVQSNIASFGGDPTRITIFGESAGAESVKQLLAQPPLPLPFHAAIIESTGTDISSLTSTSYQQVVAHFNCTTAASQIGCLRNVSAIDIKAFIEVNSVDFNPIPDRTFTEDINPYIISHQLADVSILIGSNANEGTILLPSLGLENTTLPTSTLLSLLLPGVNTSTITAILTSPFYSGLQNDTFALVAQIATDLVFTCPTSSVSNLLTANGYNVWRYYYEALFPNTNFFPNAGAYHSSEIPQVFGTYPLAGATADQEGLSGFMQGAWAGFAERGPGWPMLGGWVGDVLGVLGGEGNRTGVQVKEAAEVDGVCVLLGPLIGLGGL